MEGEEQITRTEENINRKHELGGQERLHEEGNAGRSGGRGGARDRGVCKERRATRGSSGWWVVVGGRW